MSLTRFYLFIFRPRRRERKREGKKHQCGCPLCAPCWGPGCNPGMFPAWELNQCPFGLQASAQSTEPHHPGPFSIFLKENNHWKKKADNLQFSFQDFSWEIKEVFLFSPWNYLLKQFCSHSEYIQTQMTYTRKVTFPTDNVRKAVLPNVPSCAEPSEQLPVPPDQAVSAQSLGSTFAKSARGLQSWHAVAWNLMGNTFTVKKLVS